MITMLNLSEVTICPLLECPSNSECEETLPHASCKCNTNYTKNAQGECVLSMYILHIMLQWSIQCLFLLFTIELVSFSLLLFTIIFFSSSEECTTAPCQNGATCEDTQDGGYTCTCAEWFTGSKCDTESRSIIVICSHTLNMSFSFEIKTCNLEILFYVLMKSIFDICNNTELGLILAELEVLI